MDIMNTSVSNYWDCDLEEPQVVTFMTLPVEMRLEIYAHVFNPNIHFNPIFDGDNNCLPLPLVQFTCAADPDCPRPEAAATGRFYRAMPRMDYGHLRWRAYRLDIDILSTCRRVNVEARPVLFGSYTYHFSHPKAGISFLNRFPDDVGRHVRSISLSFVGNYFWPKKHKWHMDTNEVAMETLAKMLPNLKHINFYLGACKCSAQPYPQNLADYLTHQPNYEAVKNFVELDVVPYKYLKSFLHFRAKTITFSLYQHLTVVSHPSAFERCMGVAILNGSVTQWLREALEAAAAKTATHSAVLSPESNVIDLTGESDGDEEEADAALAKRRKLSHSSSPSSLH
jgi:hypothetical protein